MFVKDGYVYTYDSKLTVLFFLWPRYGCCSIVSWFSFADKKSGDILTCFFLFIVFLFALADFNTFYYH